MKKNTRHRITLIQTDNRPQVSEILADSFSDAMDYLNQVYGNNVIVKIYNEFDRLVYMLTVNRERHHDGDHGNHGHNHGHHGHDHGDDDGGDYF